MALALAALAGCGKEPVDPGPQRTPAPVATVTILGIPSSLEVDQTVQLSVLLQDATGTTLTGRTVTWSTGDPALASVTSDGLVTALRKGMVTVTATSEGRTDSDALTIVARVLEQQAGSFHGYVSAWLTAPPADHRYGMSFYSSVFTLTPATVDRLQIGLTSTWMIPDNAAFASPLCPVGTYARDNWPERGPTWRDVFQTIEGGLGYWVSTNFRSTAPKFRINGTPDCYDSQVSSPGWGFGGFTGPLPIEKLGLVQVSNRLPVIPDGLTFEGDLEGTLLGYAWMALPLTAAYQTAGGIDTGDQSWTLFLRAANFAGPVAYYAPEIWSALTELDAGITGRGLDARPAIAGSIAMEIAEAPMFEAEDDGGTTYRRIPRLVYPVDADGRSTLAQDVRLYSKAALFDAVADWVDQVGPAPSGFDPAGAFEPQIGGTNTGLDIGPERTAIDVDAVVATGTFQTAGGGDAFGLEWTDTGSDGVFPEYYREELGAFVAVAEADVPEETGLVDQAFTPASDLGGYELSTGASSPWDEAGWAAGPFTITLNDGSVVDYVWYRFVDQPALVRLALADPVRDRLQTWVESLHAAWGSSGATLAPPTSGTLVSLESVQLLTPPAGMEVGYVPIVIAQR